MGKKRGGAEAEPKPEEVYVLFIAVSAEPVEKTVPWREGMTVGDAVDAAGYNPDKLNLTIRRGQRRPPARAGDAVAAGDRIQARERPAGS